MLTVPWQGLALKHEARYSSVRIARWISSIAGSSSTPRERQSLGPSNRMETRTHWVKRQTISMSPCWEGSKGRPHKGHGEMFMKFLSMSVTSRKLWGKFGVYFWRLLVNLEYVSLPPCKVCCLDPPVVTNTKLRDILETRWLHPLGQAEDILGKSRAPLSLPILSESSACMCVFFPSAMPRPSENGDVFCWPALSTRFQQQPCLSSMPRGKNLANPRPSGVKRGYRRLRNIRLLQAGEISNGHCHTPPLENAEGLLAFSLTWCDSYIAASTMSSTFGEMLS